MGSLNSITKVIAGTIIFVFILTWIADKLYITRVNTATEFLDNYKNCVIVRKSNSTSDYILTIKNPYTQDIRYRITNREDGSYIIENFKELLQDWFWGD